MRLVFTKTNGTRLLATAVNVRPASTNKAYFYIESMCRILLTIQQYTYETRYKTHEEHIMSLLLYTLVLVQFIEWYIYYCFYNSDLWWSIGKCVGVNKTRQPYLFDPLRQYVLKWICCHCKYIIWRKWHRLGITPPPPPKKKNNTRNGIYWRLFDVNLFFSKSLVWLYIIS